MKKIFLFLLGRSMGVSVTYITVTTGISAWLSKAFFPFKRKFPDCKSIFYVLFRIRHIVDPYSFQVVAMWKYVLYSCQYSNVTKTCSSIYSLGLVTLLDGFGRETSAWDQSNAQSNGELEFASTLFTASTIFLDVFWYTPKRRLNCLADKFL